MTKARFRLSTIVRICQAYLLPSKTLFALLIITGPLSSPAPSYADTFSACVNAKTAFEKIDHCSEVINRSKQSKQLQRAYLRRGNAYMEVNHFAEAASDFTSLIHLNPEVAGYYDNRQFAFKSLGRFGDALADANTVVRLAPSYSFGYRSRGNLNDAMGRYDAAIADFSKAISIDPSDWNLLIDQGKILAKIERNQEAIANFSRALDIDANAVAAFRERGLVYRKLGNLANAISDLTKFAQFAPTDNEVNL